MGVSMQIKVGGCESGGCVEGNDVKEGEHVMEGV